MVLSPWDGLTTTRFTGNSEGDSCALSPANVDTTLTVAATSDDDSVWPNSNTGRCVDIFGEHPSHAALVPHPSMSGLGLGLGRVRAPSACPRPAPPCLWRFELKGVRAGDGKRHFSAGGQGGRCVHRRRPCVLRVVGHLHVRAARGGCCGHLRTRRRQCPPA
jgi:hypothetical protein